MTATQLPGTPAAPIPIALTIAGSDPSGGAGIEADLRTFERFGVYGAAAITLIAVQNTTGVTRVECFDAGLVGDQIDAVLSDLRVGAIKTGALGSAEIIREIARRSLPCPLVVDPVMVSSSGSALLDAAGRRALVRELLPKAFLVTPNLAEAAELAGHSASSIDEMKAAAGNIAALGPKAVLVKGGHLDGDAVDVLFYGGECGEFRRPRISGYQIHGAGCTYSAAIAAGIAKGLDLQQAVQTAGDFVHQAIANARAVGRGARPL